MYNTLGIFEIFQTSGPLGKSTRGKCSVEEKGEHILEQVWKSKIY